MTLPIPYPVQPNTIYNWDALTLCKTMNACGMKVNTCITSPPYWMQRDYGVAGQLGQEAHPYEYVQALIEVFRAVRDVLTDDGTLWLNLGSTYAGGGRGFGNERHRSKLGSKLASAQALGRLKAPRGFKDKDLIEIPHLVALALQQNGWYLRSTIIWKKENGMPSSTTDRPTCNHEYIFLLTKSPRYYYDATAIAEPAQDWGTRDRSKGKYTSGDVPIAGGRHHGLKGIPKQDALGKRTYTGFNERYFDQPQSLTRNKRTVWHVPEQQMRMRDDLTPEQKTYVVTELVRRGLL